MESGDRVRGKVMSGSVSSKSFPVLLGLGVVVLAVSFFSREEKGVRDPAGESKAVAGRRTEIAGGVQPPRRDRTEGAAGQGSVRSEMYDTPEFGALPGWVPLFPTAARAEVEDYALRSDGLSEGKIGFLMKGEEGELLEWFGGRLAEHGMKQGEDGRYESEDRARVCEVVVKPASQGFQRVEVGFSDQGEGCGCPTCGGEGY